MDNRVAAGMALAKLITSGSVSMRTALERVKPSECFYLAPSELERILNKVIEVAQTKEEGGPTDEQKVELDLSLYGNAFTINGQHVPLNTLVLHRKTKFGDEAVALPDGLFSGPQAGFLCNRCGMMAMVSEPTPEMLDIMKKTKETIKMNTQVTPAVVPMTEELANAIIQLAEMGKQLHASPLKMDTIILLLHHLTKVGKKDIAFILNALP